MKRKMILITIIVAVLTTFLGLALSEIGFQVALARSTDYTTWLPIVISESIPTPEYLPPGNYLSRSGEWVVTFTEPKLVIKQEFVEGYMWFLVKISYKDYPSITAWVRKWDVEFAMMLMDKIKVEQIVI